MDNCAFLIIFDASEIDIPTSSRIIVEKLKLENDDLGKRTTTMS